MESLNRDCYVIMERALRTYCFLMRELYQFEMCSKNSLQFKEFALAESVLAAVVEHLEKSF